MLDEVDFPGAAPFLEPALAGDGGFHGGVGLVPDEAVYAVLPGEAVHEVVPVLPYALNEVGGDADVEGAVGSAGEDVYAGELHGRGYGSAWVRGLGGDDERGGGGVREGGAAREGGGVGGDGFPPRAEYGAGSVRGQGGFQTRPYGVMKA